MSRRPRSEPEPELVFEPVEDAEPRPSTAPPPPPKPPPKPKPKPKPEPKPKPKPKPKPPRAVRASAELRADILHRDRRGRVVGDRFAVVCPGEGELVHAVVTLSHVLSLSSVRWWVAEGKGEGALHLLEASGEGIAREMLSARLDAALDAFGLTVLREGPPRDVRLYVGGRGLFVPYTGQAAAWDVGGDLPTADTEPPRLLDPGRGGKAHAWSQQTAAGLLHRMAPRRRFGETSETTWVLASGRISRRF